MSCSSKRSRLVGSCMRTLVSSTKSLGADVLADLATCSAGRRVRSTMGLLGACGQGGSMLASRPVEYKALWSDGRFDRRVCGGKGTVCLASLNPMETLVRVPLFYIGVFYDPGAIIGDLVMVRTRFARHHRWMKSPTARRIRWVMLAPRWRRRAV